MKKKKLLLNKLNKKSKSVNIKVLGCDCFDKCPSNFPMHKNSDALANSWGQF